MPEKKPAGWAGFWKQSSSALFATACRGLAFQPGDGRISNTVDIVQVLQGVEVLMRLPIGDDGFGFGFANPRQLCELGLGCRIDVDLFGQRYASRQEQCESNQNHGFFHTRFPRVVETRTYRNNLAVASSG